MQQWWRSLESFTNCRIQVDFCSNSTQFPDPYHRIDWSSQCSTSMVIVWDILSETRSNSNQQVRVCSFPWILVAMAWPYDVGSLRLLNWLSPIDPPSLVRVAKRTLWSLKIPLPWVKQQHFISWHLSTVNLNLKKLFALLGNKQLEAMGNGRDDEDRAIFNSLGWLIIFFTAWLGINFLLRTNSATNESAFRSLQVEFKDHGLFLSTPSSGPVGREGKFLSQFFVSASSLSSCEFIIIKFHLPLPYSQ